MYSKKVMDHFLNPRNKGRLEDADAVGKVGNPVCGDVMYIYIKVKDGKIEKIGWETMGCAAAIATSSMISELAKGKTLEEAMKISKKDIAEALEGLPPIKMHCSNLAAEGLHKAIENYLNREKIIKELEKVVDRKDAEALFKIGITGIEDLKKASMEEIANAVGDEGMERIKNFLKK
ncbi:MAG TPA: iron-sulfur cluster assembly scaffold protein [Thermoplasmatales archaeon]|nr:iron-sulfur cluster assembly scaffold protein [Thermoplasmatales archaeon]